MKTTEEDNKTLIQDYYKYYGLAKIKDKNKVLKNQKLFQILKTPKKDKASDMGNYNEVKPKAMYMADLLFLPNDNGYKYCLVVVDVGSGITDAEPLRDKTSKAVLIGFKKIFTRGILDEPEYMIQCDSGGEFKNVVSEYFEKMGVYVKYGKAGRSRQMGLVESRNKQLALLLMQRMLAEELITQKVSRHWVDDLKVAITEINKIAKTKKKSKVGTKPVINKNTVYYPVGTEVRVVLDKPRDITHNTRLTGTFRVGDARWDPKTRKIKNIILANGSPLMYIVDDIPNVAYTSNQLQPVTKDETNPPASVTRKTKKGDGKKLIEITDVRKTRTATSYECKFDGYERPEWIEKSKLIKDFRNARKLIADYEDNK